MVKPKTQNKIKVGIIGTGNIGSDLLLKVCRSPVLECGIFSGQRADSPGIKRATELGIKTSVRSIGAIMDEPENCEIVFDATTANAHYRHAPVLQKLGKYTIDMTPSQVGKMCVPLLNLPECILPEVRNVNMVTCGGQATTPVIRTIMNIHPETEYIEVIASISSRSAGLGTRENIDEYTQTTADSIAVLGHAPRSKAIIILNPAEPPIMMSNTVYAVIRRPKMEQVIRAIKRTVRQVQRYVPGYRLMNEPVYEKDKQRLIVMVQVVGQGDFLPPYAGNLDIINCAAVAVAEAYACHRLTT